MNQKRLQDTLAGISLVRRFYYYEALDSTMDTARRLLGNRAPEHHHGTLLIADYQQAGRGRHGRNWNARPGQSILASLIVLPALLSATDQTPALSQLSCAIPVALCRTLQRFIPEVRIKYPNDIVRDGRKLCGILLETCGPVVIIGFGINCDQELTDLPSDLRMPASSIFLETGHHIERELILSAALSEIQESLLPQNLQPAIEDMNALCESLKHPICIDTGQGMITGTAMSITPDGRLEVLTENGTVFISSTMVVRTWPAEPGELN